MKSGWGESIHCSSHNFRPRWWFFRCILAIITGQRILVCGNHSRVESPPIELFYKPDGHNLNEPQFNPDNRRSEYFAHGYWSDEAGAEYWKTGITKGFVCSHPDCIKWAEEVNAAHKKHFSDPKKREELAKVMLMTVQIPGTDYAFPE